LKRQLAATARLQFLTAECGFAACKAVSPIIMQMTQQTFAIIEAKQKMEFHVLLIF
jgi:hypothetical protein